MYTELPLFVYSLVTNAPTDDTHLNPNLFGCIFLIPVCIKPFSSSHCQLQQKGRNKEEQRQQHQLHSRVVFSLLACRVGKRLLNLERKIYDWAALSDATEGNNVHMRGEIHGQVVSGHSSTGLYLQWGELLLQRSSCNVQVLSQESNTGEVVLTPACKVSRGNSTEA